MTPRISVHAVHRFLARLFCRWSGSLHQHAATGRLDPVARRPFQSQITSEARAALILRACACIGLKDLDAAWAILIGTGLVESDPARLNLLGVVCELRKQWRRARQFYGRAVRADRAYEPPRQNLRRVYELDTFRRSRVPVTLGDEDPQLWALRAKFLQRLEIEHRLNFEPVDHNDN